MLQTVLAFAVPTLITLTAAFFLIRKVNSCEEERRNSRHSPWNGNNSRRGGQYSSSTPNRRRRPSYDTECAICFDKKKLVELYPCGHKNFCSDCVDKIVEKSKRLCPLCRCCIRGYSD